MCFFKRHINRLNFPNKHILICEDDIECQCQIMNHFNKVFDRQGNVTISICSGGMEAASLVDIDCYIDLIILDHDMPWGNGIDLLTWMKEKKKDIPIITFSGLPSNNDNLMKHGATNQFTKQQVIDGIADGLIKKILNV